MLLEVSSYLEYTLWPHSDTDQAEQQSGVALLPWLTCVEVWPEVIFQVLADLQQHDTLQLGWLLAPTA